MEWPVWWDWDLELTYHLERRMEDRNFTEAELRQMLEEAYGYRPDVVQDRWIIEARHAGQAWEVIVEAHADIRKLVVVTAYPVER